MPVNDGNMQLVAAGNLPTPAHRDAASARLASARLPTCYALPAYCPLVARRLPRRMPYCLPTLPRYATRQRCLLPPTR